MSNITPKQLPKPFLSSNDRSLNAVSYHSPTHIVSLTKTKRKKKKQTNEIKSIRNLKLILEIFYKWETAVSLL